MTVCDCVCACFSSCINTDFHLTAYRTHISPSSIQLQTLKSEWRINKEAPWIEVDVKVISKKEETAQSVSDHIKLLQEAAIMAQFRHPNVMRLHGIVTEGDTV